MNQALYIFSGLPGVGKSTVSREFCRRNGFAYIRVDTVEQGLRDFCDLDVYDEGYHLSHLIAADNLKLGLSVVADSCNPIELSRDEWEVVARSAGVRFVNIEVICSEESEHKRRIESREVPIPGLKLPDWQAVCDREYQEWTRQRVRLDTAGKSLDESVLELSILIEEMN